MSFEDFSRMGYPNLLTSKYFRRSTTVRHLNLAILVFIILSVLLAVFILSFQYTTSQQRSTDKWLGNIICSQTTFGSHNNILLCSGMAARSNISLRAEKSVTRLRFIHSTLIIKIDEKDERREQDSYG